MKKLLSFILSAIVFFNTISLSSAKENVISFKHWSKSYIDAEFMEKYFPESIAQYYKNPDGAILHINFFKALKDICKESKLNIEIQESKQKYLKRDEMALSVYKAIKDANIKNVNKIENFNFSDIKDLSEDKAQAIKFLYLKGVISGSGNAKYRPYANLTLAEGVITLQRLYDIFKNIDEKADTGDNKTRNELTFKILSISNDMSKKSTELYYNEDAGKVNVFLTLKFNTPGYSLGIEKIVKDGKKITIYPQIIPPKKGSIDLQVITYKTVNIELLKEELGEGPYDFEVYGEKIDTGFTM